MKHTAQPGTLLAEFCDAVASMKPGEWLVADRHILKEIPSFFHNEAQFNPADRILGNIIGSAYTHSYQVDPMTGDVTFKRHTETGRRYYNDPDRRNAIANATDATTKTADNGAAPTP